MGEANKTDGLPEPRESKPEPKRNIRNSKCWAMNHVQSGPVILTQLSYLNRTDGRNI